MKKILFSAFALIIVMVSCVKDEPYPGISIDLSYAPDVITELDDVTVSASIASFYSITEAVLYYTIDDSDEIKSVNMTKEDDGKSFSAIIPAQPDKTKVDFYVKATSEKMQATSATMGYKVGDNVDYSVIVLNELNGDQKFIEVYNQGEYDLPLKGMTIKKDDDKTIWTGTEVVVAPAYGYVVLVSDKNDGVDPDDPFTFAGGLSAKKTLKIELIMPDGSIRDVFTRGNTGLWGQDISNVAPQSYARTPDAGDWKLADPTPGEANPAEGEDIPQE
jgi:hypothetical protein